MKRRHKRFGKEISSVILTRNPFDSNVLSMLFMSVEKLWSYMLNAVTLDKALCDLVNTRYVVFV